MRKVKFGKFTMVLGFIAFALIILFFVEKLINIKSKDVAEMKVRGEALISKNQGEVFKGAYDEFILPNVVKGDTISATIHVPIEDFNDPVLVFSSGYNQIKVYQGDSMIYSYGELQYKKDVLIGDTQLMIPLVKEKGNEIRLEITVENSMFLFELPELLLMDSMVVGDFKLSGNMVHTYLGLFLFLFGVILLTFFISNLQKAYLACNLELLILAFYSMLGGIWMWAHYGVLEIFWDNTHAIYVANIVCEYTMPVLVLFFFSIHLQSRKAKFLCKGLAYSAVFFVGVILLALAMKEFFPFISHIVLWFYFVLIIAIFEGKLAGMYHKNKSKMYGILLASVITYYISILMCFITLRKDDFSFTFFHKMYCNTIVFVIIQMFLSYSIPMIRELRGRTEREVLMELAYVDELTGLMNRTRSEEIMNQIRTEEENFYYVAEFEILNLKKINRSCGYVVGDRLLIQFAQELQNSFQDAMLVSRYSGNEFLVILENESKETLDRCMELLAEKIAAYNAKQEGEAILQYVYGIGECNCMEKGNDIYKLLRVIDKRKYEKAKQAYFECV